ncbi:hypothetical protein [Aquisalibacillus elongatus]|uniref:DUF3951 domain-containing protein n=1 Tax=Aquisalibacillus elongatus TaxID=485577 RepID=A0A3N5B061_9BACI|nr:hypothetical protein [Aquisalibacillus elongatus]RPF50603.1 hypothetical protein EDC24_2571 [Aquisalibacillus elongatus]
MLGYVISLIIPILIIIVLFRNIKKDKKSSEHRDTNNYTTEDHSLISYTPYDDITMGTVPEVKKDRPNEDTKHQVGYVEDSERHKESDT